MGCCGKNSNNPRRALTAAENDVLGAAAVASALPDTGDTVKLKYTGSNNASVSFGPYKASATRPFISVAKKDAAQLLATGRFVLA